MRLARAASCPHSTTNPRPTMAAPTDGTGTIRPIGPADAPTVCRTGHATAGRPLITDPDAIRRGRRTWRSSASRSMTGSATGRVPASGRAPSARRPPPVAATHWPSAWSRSGSWMSSTRAMRTSCPHGPSEATRSPTNASWRSCPAARCPSILGGDHSITWPVVSAVAQTVAPRRVGMIHFDAHADTADEELGVRAGHGTPMRRLDRVRCARRARAGPGRPARLLAAARRLRLDARAGDALAPR